VSGAVAIVLLVVAGIVVGGTFVVGAPVLAIPLLLLLPGPVFAAGMLRRQASRRRVARFREQAQAQKTEFDARDERTLV
jgi:hypothetical protein